MGPGTRRLLRSWLAALLVVTAGTATVSPARGADPVGARFVPVVPCRVLDTRAPSEPLTPMAERVVAMVGRCGIGSDATAVALTLTMVGPEADGWVAAWPANRAWPGTSSINAAAGTTAATTTVVGLGDGAVSVLGDQPTHLLLDVSGYFVPSAASREGRFVPVTPERVLDTRAGGRPEPGGSVRVSLPASAAGAIAAAVNITTDASSGTGYFTAYPAGGPLPVASVLNTDGAGETRAAFAIVPVNAGAFEVSTTAGDHVIVDLAGYFTGPGAALSTDGLFVPLPAPRRLLDTRLGGAGRVLGADRGIEISSVSAGAASVGTLTATRTVDAGYFATYPAGTGRPGTSTVNATGYWSTVANGVIVPASTRGITVSASAGGHVIYDEVGFFTGAPVTASEPVEENDPSGALAYPAAPCDRSATGMDGIGAGSDTLPREYVRIGTSVRGRPITAEYWGPERPDHVVLVTSVVHGDECAAARLVHALRAAPPDGSYGAWVIPVLNPDGWVADTRENANGVDLNEDGAAQTQPETRALMEFTRRLRPDLAVHAHSPNGFVGWFAAGSYVPSNPIASRAVVSGPIAASVVRRTNEVSAPGFRIDGAGHRADRSRWFLWQGQAEVLPGLEALLVEFYAVANAEAPLARPRPPTRTVAAADAHARAVLAAIDDVL